MNKAFENLQLKLDGLLEGRTEQSHLNQIEEHEVKVLKRALDIYQTILYEKIPDTPFICGEGGEKKNGMPEYFFISPTYGVDVGCTYHYKRVDNEKSD